MKGNKTLLAAAALSLAIVGVGSFTFLANGETAAVESHGHSHATATAAGDLEQFVVHGNYVHYDNVEELEAFADLIIVGSPAKAFKEEKATVVLNAEGFYEDFFTTTDVKVQKVLKGNADKNVEIMQPAAITESLDGQKDIYMIQDDFSVMEKGQKYLLFLKKMDNGKYSIISVNQGKFNVDGLDKEEKKLDEHLKHHAELRDKVMKKYADKL